MMLDAVRCSGSLPTFIRTALTSGLFGAVVGCAPAIDVHTIQSPSAHFDAYRTVAFEQSPQPPSDYSPSPQSAQVRTEVQDRAGDILQGRGYVVAKQQDADLVIRIEAGRRERVVTVTAMQPTSPSAPVETEFHGELDREQEDLVDGAFVIDAFDGKTHALVWHGAARTEVTPGTIDHGRVRSAVEKVLASFPAAPSSK
ncbi:MAG TPA: DUF4136 domain-containing protein [Polyangiaceae bacterium]|nr:DUF4136 domain-containing protein [Polyangiaceae bacterium]